MSSVVLAYPDPPLSDGAIGVRRWRDDDVDCVRQAGLDPEVPKATTVPARFTPEAGLAFIRRQWARIENNEGVSQAITDAATDRAIGLLWLPRRPQPRVAGLGYWVVPAARRRGAAAAAVRLIVPWAFDTLGFKRIEAWVKPDNIASQHVLQNAGFQREGRLRNFLILGGRSSDVLVFSRIPS